VGFQSFDPPDCLLDRPGLIRVYHQCRCKIDRSSDFCNPLAILFRVGLADFQLEGSKTVPLNRFCREGDQFVEVAIEPADMRVVETHAILCATEEHEERYVRAVCCKVP